MFSTQWHLLSLANIGYSCEIHNYTHDERQHETATHFNVEIFCEGLKDSLNVLKHNKTAVLLLCLFVLHTQ